MEKEIVIESYEITKYAGRGSLGAQLTGNRLGDAILETMTVGQKAKFRIVATPIPDPPPSVPCFAVLMPNTNTYSGLPFYENLRQAEVRAAGTVLKVIPGRFIPDAVESKS